MTYSDITSELIYQAYSALLADAEKQAINRNIPLDRSWTFHVWTSADTSSSQFSTDFVIYGRWIQSSEILEIVQ